MGQHNRLELRHGVAVVTDAAGGIGAALALQLAQRGCHLALADVRGTELQATAAQARAAGITVSTHVMDMAPLEAAAQLLAQVQAAHGRATVLVNNAGVALVGHFEQAAGADIDGLMAVNFGAVVRHDLEDSGSTVGMTIVHPGGVRTGIGANARRPAQASAQEKADHEHRWRMALRLSPEDAATRILQGLERREPRVLVGQDAVADMWLQRLFPVRYWRIMARGVQRRLGHTGTAAPAPRQTQSQPPTRA